MNRAHIGREEFSRATGGRGPAAVAAVREASHVLADGVQEFIFADVFSRPGLTARERELVTVATLCVIGGAERQLALHLGAALECGADGDELVAVCEQIAPYAGFPRALNALRAVREALAERDLPLPPPAERVSLSDHDTTISRDGSGPAVVLIHPLGADRMVWRDVWRALSSARDVVAPDLRGHGDAAGAPSAGIDAMAHDVRDLVDVLGLETVTLVGAGSGAHLALRAADALGTRATSVLLAGPMTVAPAGDVPDVLAGWLTPRTLAADGWAVRHLRDRLARAPAEARERLERSAGGATAPACPTRVVVGEADPDLDGARTLAGALGAPVEVLAGAGHLLPVEDPAGLAEAVLAG